MTEREGGSGKPKDNVRDEFDEASEHHKTGKDTSKDAVEREGESGGGGVKDNVQDEWDKSQRR
ncbi:MAG: hypothetical protein M3151_10800 [Actinomycetota bacterium]|nr:hypothetical protein [Actinomycetota bacterium]